MIYTTCEVVAMLNRVAVNLLYLFFSCFLIVFSFTVLSLMNNSNIKELRRYCKLLLKQWFHSEVPYRKHFEDITVLVTHNCYKHFCSGTPMHYFYLTFWRRNFFFNFCTFCMSNVNNTGTKYVRIMKQPAF